LHIRDEIDGLAAALHGLTFIEYQKSYTLRRVAERALEIISEAAKSLPAELRDRHRAAPWSAIIGIGNILRHEYQRLEDRRMWEIATVHLPQLRPIIFGHARRARSIAEKISPGLTQSLLRRGRAIAAALRG
jgi:uncharacterized protein with HEPN domain